MYCYAGVVDATLLALAGLKRLGMHDLIASSQIISWDDMLPAVAQGAIGIQCREDDERVLHYLAALNHEETKIAVDCERAFLARLDGNCRTPIAGQARVIDGQVHFRGMIAMPDGTDMIKVERVGKIEDAITVGKEAGEVVKLMAGSKFINYQEATLQATSSAAAASGSWSNLQT